MKLKQQITVELNNGLTGNITDFVKNRPTDQFDGFISGLTTDGLTYTGRNPVSWDKFGRCRDNPTTLNISCLNPTNKAFFDLAATVKK